MEVKHDKSKLKNRFLLLKDGVEIGEMTYVFVKDNIIDINHTLIDEQYRGNDCGLKLVAAAVDYMRKENITARASCPYVKKVFKETTAYADVIA